MDKQLQPRFSRRTIIAAALSVVSVAVGGLLWIVPGMNRLQFVASIGVHSANTLTIVFYTVGGVLVAIGGVSAFWAVKRFIADGKHYKLPPRDEKNPVQIEKHLKMVATRYPDTAGLVQESLDQLEEIRRSLKTINDYFEANRGAFIEGDATLGYGAYEPLLQRITDEMSENLIGLVYKAHAAQSSSELKRDFNRVIGIHQERVEAAQELAETTSQTISSGAGNSTDASIQLRKLTELAKYATH